LRQPWTIPCVLHLAAADYRGSQLHSVWSRLRGGLLRSATYPATTAGLPGTTTVCGLWIATKGPGCQLPGPQRSEPRRAPEYVPAMPIASTGWFLEQALRKSTALTSNLVLAGAPASPASTAGYDTLSSYSQPLSRNGYTLHPPSANPKAA